MYEVIFNTLLNPQILHKSAITPEYRAKLCAETKDKILSWDHPQTGYFATRKEARAAIVLWYSQERKRLLKLVRYCRNLERRYASK